MLSGKQLKLINMAKPSWLNISNASGSGTGTIINTAVKNTGRLARTGIVTIDVEGLDNPITYKVIQEAKPEFASYDYGAEMYAPKKGGIITITGKSNSSRLSFSLIGEDSSAILDSTYSAGGLITNNGEYIKDDPGALSEYFFAIKINISSNDTDNEISRALEVVTENGNVSYITIVQTNIDSYLYLSHTEITIPQDGYAVPISVTSNTVWTLNNGN